MRVERLAEAVRLIKRLFTEDEVTFQGRYYDVKAAQARPVPVQRPGPPIMVAGGGRRILSLAAREADIVAPIPRTDRLGRPRRDEFARGALERQMRWIREEAGPRADRLEINLLLVTTIVTYDRAAALAELAGRLEQPESLVADSPFLALGSLEEIRTQLVRTRERFGITYFCVRGEHVDALAPVARDLR
ncbi:hypothetical protein BH18CHL2_BH18CHL2_04180 [soil metagenome]